MHRRAIYQQRNSAREETKSVDKRGTLSLKTGDDYEKINVMKANLSVHSSLLICKQKQAGLRISLHVIYPMYKSFSSDITKQIVI